MSQRVSNVGASSVRRMCGACAKWPVMSAKASFAQMICPVVASATTVGSGDFVTAGRISPPSISIVFHQIIHPLPPLRVAADRDHAQNDDDGHADEAIRL